MWKPGWQVSWAASRSADDISAEAVTNELVEHGFITRPLRGNTVQISPPFITTDDEIRQLVAAIDTVLSAQEAKQ